MQTDVFLDFPWLQVLVAALAFFALGALWYSVLFSKAWIRLTGIDVNDPKMKTGVAAIMTGSFVLMLLSSFGLGVLVTRLEIIGWMSGLKLGLITGCCFAATAISITYLYEKKSLGLHLINGGYSILGHCIMSIIICSWQ